MKAFFQSSARKTNGRALGAIICRVIYLVNGALPSVHDTLKMLRSKPKRDSDSTMVRIGSNQVKLRLAKTPKPCKPVNVRPAMTAIVSVELDCLRMSLFRAKVAPVRPPTKTTAATNIRSTLGLSPQSSQRSP
eukprot:206238-Amphidinium_carterae.1